MQHFTLGVAHIVLELGEKGHCSSDGHGLEHVFLPVLAQRTHILGHVGGEVAGDDFLLSRVGDHFDNTFAIAVDGGEEVFALTGSRREHHRGSGFKVFLVLDVTHIGILAIALPDDTFFKCLGQLVERVGHLPHILCLIIPLLHLFRVLLHLLVEVLIYSLVGLRSIGSGTVQTVIDQREPLQYVARHIECEHGHQDDVHEVDHLLAW